MRLRCRGASKLLGRARRTGSCSAKAAKDVLGSRLVCNTETGGDPPKANMCTYARYGMHVYVWKHEYGMDACMCMHAYACICMCVCVHVYTYCLGGEAEDQLDAKSMSEV